ncbi:MAG: di-heme oxidoredictase family protein, partial [Bdellovibrionota bacterium]
MDLLRSGQKSAAFLASFESGDLFFEHVFKDSEGAGAYVGDGSRFTTIPRADLDGPGEWANHYPSRSTGPNARSCVACHDAPFSDGSGTNNEHRDPFHFGDPSRYIVRNTPHIFGLGGLQKLAEEMTDELHDQLDDVKDWSCTLGKTLKKKLSAKGISYGSIEVKPSWDSTGICDFKIDWSSLQGIDSDLVVKPFQWKGSVASIRDFNRGASHNELGIQAVELVGDSRDGDYDDIVDEATVGDMTALAVYAAAQQRPTSKQELSRLGLIPKLTRDEEASIHRGKDLFSQVGCASCHVPQLKLRDPIFSEPSRSPYYRDTVFPSGQKPMDRGVDPAAAVTFDLTRDQPSNQIKNEKGEVVYRLGSFEKDFWGRPVVELYSDLKRHD